MNHSVKSVDSYNGFHVLNLDPEGYIVTADDDEIEPVIAFSDKGRFSTDPQNSLWVLLNHDLPARAKHLKRIKANHSGSSLTQVDSASPAVMIRMRHTNAGRIGERKERRRIS